MHKLLSFFVLFSLIVSCTSDKLNTSLVLDRASFTPQQTLRRSILEGVTDSRTIRQGAELNSTLDTFPVLGVEKVDAEVRKLKFYATEIMYAIKEYNVSGREKAKFRYQQSYQKLQRIKQTLEPEKQDLLNRYLTKVKTDVSLLESSLNETQKTQ